MVLILFLAKVTGWLCRMVLFSFQEAEVEGFSYVSPCNSYTKINTVSLCMNYPDILIWVPNNLLISRKGRLEFVFILSTLQ